MPRGTKDDDVDVGLSVLSDRDEALRVHIDALRKSARHYSSLYSRPEYSAFTSLTKSICSQQIGTKAARTIFGRVKDLCPSTSSIDVCPRAAHLASDDILRQAGLSAAKRKSIKDLASRFVHGELSDEVLSSVDDMDRLGKLLLPVKGIGPWTVQMFGIFYLGLPDVEVLNDLGVRKGCAKIYGLKHAPSKEAMARISSRWRPHRSLGARLCWKALDI
jgi:DNA-3-methyladenine glycosylase II